MSLKLSIDHLSATESIAALLSIEDCSDKNRSRTPLLSFLGNLHHGIAWPTLGQPVPKRHSKRGVLDSRPKSRPICSAVGLLRAMCSASTPTRSADPFTLNGSRILVRQRNNRFHRVGGSCKRSRHSAK